MLIMQIMLLLLLCLCNFTIDSNQIQGSEKQSTVPYQGSTSQPENKSSVPHTKGFNGGQAGMNALAADNSSPNFKFMRNKYQPESQKCTQSSATCQDKLHFHPIEARILETGKPIRHGDQSYSVDNKPVLKEIKSPKINSAAPHGECSPRKAGVIVPRTRIPTDPSHLKECRGEYEFVDMSCKERREISSSSAKPQKSPGWRKTMRHGELRNKQDILSCTLISLCIENN